MTELDLKLQDLKNAFENLKEENKRFKFSNSILEKELQEYKQLEKQGLLLKLPCKVGDKCYVSNATFKRVFEVYCISISKDKENVWVRCGNGLMYIWNEEIFATKAEAEKALAKLSEVE